MGVARCDRHGVIVEMNPAMARTLGQDAENARPVRLSELAHTEARDEIDQLAQEVREARRDSFRLLGSRDDRGPGGTKDEPQHATAWTVWRMAANGDDAEESLLLIEEQAASASGGEGLQQRQQWEAVGRLAGGVFHDFNNLLTGVMLYCELLLAGLESEDRLRRYADEIRSASLHASGIVRQLLGLTRPGGPAPQLLSLNDIASGMQDLLGRLIGEHIEVRYCLARDLGLVNIDPAQAQQVVLNLALNARDALPHGGTITLETSNCKLQTLPGTSAAQTGMAGFPCIQLSVSDNGHGMDAATRQRLFDPFFTTKLPEKGNGLGLTTVHNIVARSGGLIHVGSESGQGTRVMILLPTASTTAPVSRETSTQDSGVPLEDRLQAQTKEFTL
jgi:signal transduction histidine kinase